MIGLGLVGLDQLPHGQSQDIVVDDSVVNRLNQLWQAQMGQPPTAAELAAITESWIDEELYYREALRLGLDQNDTIVRRRLVQKLQFLETGSATLEPDADEVARFFNENPERYRLTPSVTLSQVLIRSPQPERVREVESQLAGTADYRLIGDASSLNADYADQTPDEIATVFGSDFARSVFALDDNEGGLDWFGPVESIHGTHFIRVRHYQPPRIPDVGEVYDDVVMDLISERQERQADQYLNSLRERYHIIRRDLADGA